ncbi:MAG: glutamyl-tRNA reductase [Planctomycetes bacterium]|nr:glutamyl-tRNA reductase [Planctomycetota bacterium]
MKITVVGISHRTATVEVREQFALPGGLAGELLRAVKAEGVFGEALLLDTCNRTEMYLVAPELEDCATRMAAHLARLKHISPLPDASLLYRRDGTAAVEHLFRVSASLDSQILGEDQILGQIKNAYSLAVEEKSTGFVLNRLMHRAIRVGKRVRTETQLGRGAAGIPHAAVELAIQIFATLAGKTVMLVGAGETAELAARNLIACGVSNIIVANRTLERAQRMAAQLAQGAAGVTCPTADDESTAGNDTTCPARPSDDALPITRAIGLDDIPNVIRSVDLVICSTGSPEAVLTYDNVGEVLRTNRRPLFIVDIAVPRDVDPRLNDLSNVFLYNIDDLKSIVAANLERRRHEMPRAEAIVSHEVELFSNWLDSLQVAPIVKLLQEHFDQLRRAEIKRYGKQFSEADNEQLEVFTRSLCKKLLHEPLTFLRQVSRDNSIGDSETTVEIVRRMFGISQPDEPAENT